MYPRHTGSASEAVSVGLASIDERYPGGGLTTGFETVFPSNALETCRCPIQTMVGPAHCTRMRELVAEHVQNMVSDRFFEEGLTKERLEEGVKKIANEEKGLDEQPF